MDIITGSRNRLVKFTVYVVEIGLCALLFFFICRRDFLWGLDDIRFCQSMLLTVISFGICTVSGGIVFITRETKVFQVILVVTRNIVYFVLITAAVLFLGRFYVPSWKYSLVLVVSLFVLCCLFRISMRWLLKAVTQSVKRMPQVVFVGCCESNLAIYREFTDNPQSYCRVQGYFNDEPDTGHSQDSCDWLGRTNGVLPYLKAHPEVDEVYCCLQDSDNSEAVRILKYCEDNFIRFYNVLDLHSFLYNHSALTVVGNVPCLSFFDGPLERAENRFIKRLFDIVVSVIVLLTVFPIAFIIVAVVTSITMPGPIFFLQKRTGIKGREFTIIKFRSMKVNSEADEIQATEDDPRKTKWGDIMRHTNLDELPQFVNVFLGNMSIVGPRPHMVKQTEEFSNVVENYMVRHNVKPGITGWSQVSGFRGEFKDVGQVRGRIEHDIWYIEHWSAWLDIYIILLTIYKSCVGDKQAY